VYCVLGPGFSTYSWFDKVDYVNRVSLISNSLLLEIKTQVDLEDMKTEEDL
jgi:hypothetical protein